MLQAYCTTSLNRIQNKEFECQMQTGRSFTPNTQWDATLMCFYESKKSVGIPSSAVPEFDISNAEYRIVEGWIYKNKHARKTRSCQSNNKVGRSQATGPTRWSYVTDRSNWCPIMWLHDLYE